MTVASFNEWRARFDAEMRGSQKVSLKDEATSKLTGITIASSMRKRPEEPTHSEPKDLIFVCGLL